MTSGSVQIFSLCIHFIEVTYKHNILKFLDWKDFERMFLDKFEIN